MNKQIQDCLGFALGGVSADISSALDSAYVSAADARRILAHVQAVGAADASTLTVQFREATDDQGTGVQNLGSAITQAAPSGGGDISITPEIRADELSEGFTHVTVRISVDAGAPAGAIGLVSGDRRFNP